MIRLTKKEISKFSLKKNTPVVLAKILKTLIIRNRKTCFLILPYLFKKAQFRPSPKLVAAPNIEPIVVAVT